MPFKVTIRGRAKNDLFLFRPGSHEDGELITKEEASNTLTLIASKGEVLVCDTNSGNWCTRSAATEDGAGHHIPSEYVELF